MSRSIEIKGFKKRYRQAVVKMDEMRIEGRLSLLLGGNGAGKTTLLKAMAGLIRYEGRITNAESAVYVGSDPSFPSALSVAEYFRFLSSLAGDHDEERMRRLLGAFSLSDESHKSLAELSRGNRQKVNLVQAFLAKKELCLLDEPLSGLDKQARRVLADHLSQSRGRFIVATHELSFLAGLPSRRYRL